MNRIHDNDRKKLGYLISQVVEGPEQGVQTRTTWRWNRWELVKLCKELDISVHGQWTLEPKDYEHPQATS